MTTCPSCHTTYGSRQLIMGWGDVRYFFECRNPDCEECNVTTDVENVDYDPTPYEARL